MSFDGSSLLTLLLVLAFLGLAMFPLVWFISHWRDKHFSYEMTQRQGMIWHGVWFVVWVFVASAILVNHQPVSDSMREVTYEREHQKYNMGNCDWKIFFRDAAYKSSLSFLSGGDEERGELSIYFQQECEDHPRATASLSTAREHHGTLDKYRNSGLGGWDGTYPEWNAW